MSFRSLGPHALIGYEILRVLWIGIDSLIEVVQRRVEVVARLGLQA
jgi:hypothetical protein